MSITLIICASYNESPVTVSDPVETGKFFEVGIHAERNKDVWSNFSGCKKPSEFSTKLAQVIVGRTIGLLISYWK